MATSHKYEQVNTDLKKDGLGDGLSGNAFEAEAKARRILADDAEDLWTGLSKAGNDLKDASNTVNIIGNAAHNLVARIKGDDLEISETGAITPSETGSTDSEARSRDVSQLSWVMSESVTDLLNKQVTRSHSSHRPTMRLPP